MLTRSFSYGLDAIRSHLGLVALLYGVGVAVAFVLAMPLYIALQDTLDPSGFGPDLFASFDIVVWADVLQQAGPVLNMLMGQMLWMVPLYALWRVASQVGLLHALRDGGAGRSFWEGVGRFTGRGLLVSLTFFVVQGGAMFVATIVLGAIVATSGEFGIFWGVFVAVPAVLVTIFAICDLMLDYALAAVVIGHCKPMAALGEGIRFPFKHGVASWLYLVWFALAAICTLAPTQLEFVMHGVWGLFVLQQLFLLFRTAITVGWIGSTAYVYETTYYAALPLIAEAAPEEASATSNATMRPEGDDGLALA